MSVTSQFYLARAAECARDAEAALLDNVRDRYRRSEAAWRAMADRLTRAEVVRAEETARKAGEQVEAML